VDIDLARSAILIPMGSTSFWSKSDDDDNVDHIKGVVDFCDDRDHEHYWVYGDDDPDNNDPRSINSSIPAHFKMLSYQLSIINDWY